MLERDQQQAELLHQFWERLHADPTVIPPAELDLDLALLARALEEQVRPPEPDDSFATRLRRRLEAQASASSPNGHAAGSVQHWPWLRIPISATRWRLAGLATAVVIILALLGVALWTLRPQPVSAQEIIRKAQATFTAPDASQIRSFVLTEVMIADRSGSSLQNMPLVTGPVHSDQATQIHSETRRWYQAPDRGRIEDVWTALDANGAVVARRDTLSVSDGIDTWTDDRVTNAVTVSRQTANPGDRTALVPFDPGADDLAAVLKNASTCYAPVLRGSATIAGRSAYVIDLGPSQCPSASAPEINGPRTIWVDKQTFFLLKDVLYDVHGKPLITQEVTSIAYNVPIDPSLFTFAPLPGARVQDERPKPTPSAEQFQQQLAQLAKQVDFPVFVPATPPSGLVPLQPRLDSAPVPRVAISYAPPDEAGQAAAGGPHGVTIVEQRAMYSMVAGWTAQAVAMPITGGQGWLRRGLHNADGTGSNSAAIVLRDGTLISVASFTVAPDELAIIAASLQPVSGSHPSLPNPTPPPLAALRQRVSYPVFVPSWVPDGLTPEPPTGGEQPGAVIQIRYHTNNGGVALTVLEGPAGCCLDADGRKDGQSVLLPTGIRAGAGTQNGANMLWWDQDGTYVAISGPHLTQDGLLRIASSMSKTPDLGTVAIPATRPTPTPIPTPAYRILRPTWLPEPMTEREQIRSDSPGVGPLVELGFAPRPNDKPHMLLTLSERPLPNNVGAAQATPATADPQGTHEIINGRDVTIIRRGQGCVTATWNQDGLSLTLTNPYDPPGPPGAVRYSCEQFRKIIASIR